MSLSVHPHTIADRAMLADATELMGRFGDAAATEAGDRAERSRDIGNVLGFCRWRQAERLIRLLDAREVLGTVN